MADLTTAWGLEGEFALLGCRIVTGRAGELLVPLMLETVCSDRLKEPRRRIGCIRRRIAFPAGLPDVWGWPHRLLHRLQGVERNRRVGATARAGHTPANPLVTGLTVAGIDSGGMGVVTGDALELDFAMGRPGMEPHLPPCAVALRIGAGLEGVLRSRLRVGIVAHTAGAAVGIGPGSEPREPLLHLMTRQTLPEVGT